MNIRPLIIDDAARAKVAMVVAWATDHHLDAANPTFTPGDDWHFVATLGTYRTVFTFTRDGDQLYRHLSVSVPEANKYPNPVAMWLIADLYGFTGWTPEMGIKPAADWGIKVLSDEHAVMIVQPMKVS